mmetsp:Transcript_1769/g.5301  ORF Transcript_1769/g.5301 Transcript_1769/m.5301 type:complete len:242 (-) Transcript_1769:63-788(-)
MTSFQRFRSSAHSCRVRIVVGAPPGKTRSTSAEAVDRVGRVGGVATAPRIAREATPPDQRGDPADAARRRGDPADAARRGARGRRRAPREPGALHRVFAKRRRREPNERGQNSGHHRGIHALRRVRTARGGRGARRARLRRPVARVWAAVARHGRPRGRPGLGQGPEHRRGGPRRHLQHRLHGVPGQLPQRPRRPRDDALRGRARAERLVLVLSRRRRRAARACSLQDDDDATMPTRGPGL